MGFLIAGDSIIKHLGHPLSANLLCLPGTTLEIMTNLISGWTVPGQIQLDLWCYKVLVIHVGTNNVGQPTKSILEGYKCYTLTGQAAKS